MPTDANYAWELGQRSPGLVSIVYAANANSASTGANCISGSPQQPRTVLDGASDYGRELVANNGRSDSEGIPAPCLAVYGFSMYRFRISVRAGPRSLTIKAKQPLDTDPPPYVTIRANDDIGVSAATATAPVSTGWVTIGPMTFTASGNGAIWIELVNPSNGTPCYFDNITIQ